MVERPRVGHAGGMTTSPPEAPEQGPPTGPRVSRAEITDLGRLRRTGRDRRIAGVAGGLARHLDIDPVILRVAFVVLIFFGGAGLILYAAVWLLVPRDGSDTAPIRLDVRSRTVALYLVGVIAVLALLGDSVGGWGFPWPLVLIGLVVLLVVSGRSQRSEPGPSAPGPAGAVAASPPTAPISGGYRPPTPDARRRGPLLFWFTMALAALAVGGLGIVDLAGVEVAPSAYPALALAVTGLLLLVGAFYGRAGGLILAGLILSVATAGTAVGERVDLDFGDVDRTPVTAEEVADRYQLGVGDLRVDLTEVGDPENLDGRTVDFDLDLGQVEVIVPEGIDVRVVAALDGFGQTRLFDESRDASNTAFHDGGDDVPTLTLDARVGVGEINIHTPGRFSR